MAGPAGAAGSRVARLAGMRITVLAGGVGAARFLRGLKSAAPDAEITVIGNTGDDISLFGLHVSPDLDTVMYTLGGGIDEEQGWGRARRHLHRAGGTGRLRRRAGLVRPGRPGHRHPPPPDQHARRRPAPVRGHRESSAHRWQPGVALLPMSDDRVETQVILRDEGGRTVHFQEWWVRLHADVPAAGFVLAGAEDAAPAPGVLEAIGRADVVLLPPSNPVVSVGTILAVPGIAEALRAKTVVGVSPIIGGAPVRGMADKCLAAIGVEASAAGVAAHYGAGPARRLAGGRARQGGGGCAGTGRSSPSGRSRST